MNKFSSQKIGQQMYTRARSGIFRDTEGYDTIARSAGLDDQFVKKTLHPLCAYDAPAELTASGVKEESAYPDSVHLVQLENGDVVLGRSLYKSADFTGLRSSFFTHNYVIPAEKAESLKTEYMNFLYADYVSGEDDFSAEAPDGAVLSELESLPMRTKLPKPKTGADKLDELELDGASFKRLLLAVMESVNGRRKVYVTLNAPVADLSARALRLLEVLYAALPPAFRRRLGFMTYSREPQNRKGVNLTFVEQGSMRPGDRNIEKDFLFDFFRGRIINAAEGGSLQELGDFLHNGLSDPQRLERFFAFADEALGSSPEELNSERYLELSRLFMIEEGDETPYESDRRGILALLLGWTRRSGETHIKARMLELLAGRFDREMQDLMAGRLPEPELLRDILGYFRVGGKGAGALVLRYLLTLMPMVTRQKRKDGGMAYFAVIESDPELADMFFSTLIGNRQLASMLFEPYLDRKMEAAADASEVVRLVQKWSDDHPGLLQNEHFCDVSRRTLGGKLRRSADPVSAVRSVVETLRGDGNPTAGLMDGTGEELMKHPLCVTLADEAIQYLLDEWEWNKVTLQQVTGLGFLYEGETEEERKRKVRGPRGTGKYAALRAAYLWFTQERPDAGLLEGLELREMDEVQMLGKRLLPAEIAAGRYSRLLPAFSRSLSGGGEDVDYRRLVDAVRINSVKSGGREEVYRFFAWSARQEPYVQGKRFDPAYEAEIIRYFAAHDREAFRDKNNRREYFDNAPPPLASVYRKVQAQQAPPLVRWMRKNRRLALMLMGVLALLIVGGGTVGVLYATGVLGGQEQAAQTPAAPAVDPSSENGTDTPGTVESADPAMLVFAPSGSGTIEFRFRTAAERNAFVQAPPSLTLELLNGGSETVPSPELQSVDLEPGEGSTGTDGSSIEGPDAGTGADSGAADGESSASDGTGTAGQNAGEETGSPAGAEAEAGTGEASGTETDSGTVGTSDEEPGAEAGDLTGTGIVPDAAGGLSGDQPFGSENGTDAAGEADSVTESVTGTDTSGSSADPSAGENTEVGSGSAYEAANPANYLYTAVFQIAESVTAENSPIERVTVDGESYAVRTDSAGE
ncbi:GAP1-N2 domain-containing protein [Saccharibacillus kuerlensis]|uniref:Glycosyltransferase n=1 Tax=Saccharibacillus kuerlensis TaxID=459527 RepID=A0ABQ2L2L2_9BACL|nr:hypothetical protein [Saccharibacillus kuerlensis]GGO00527.1 hypothetical protein GCM10010969_21870 [Saccharibacillus kuerlensis]